MAKFLIKGSYTAEGAKALAKEGGSRRKEAVEKMVGSLGGKIEAFKPAGGWQEAARGVFGAEACFDGMASELDGGLGR